MASGQGKTTVTAALARKLVRAGRRVRIFKCGPDFIDPMLLERACGAPVHTLDLWMVGIDECRRRLAEAALEADAVLVEGVMGLYDGTPSAADLARTFGIPVLAVIDVSAMAQTAGAVARGLRDHGPVQLAGVVANRVASSGHARMVAQSLREIALVGSLPRQTESLPERHLGLVLPHELPQLDALLDELADALQLDDASWQALPLFEAAGIQAAPAVPPLLAGRTIAIARDAAFAFLYPANLDTLRALGARLVFFSPLANQAVPNGVDAIYLPGGYPELHAQALAGADRWRASIAAAFAAGLPIVAECGGMMVLADELADPDGERWPMAGLLPGVVRMQSRLAGLGAQALDTPAGVLRGHTFHYSCFDTPQAAALHTVRHPAGTAGEAVYRAGSLTASYFHAYFPSNPEAVAALFTGGAAWPAP
jgi:cobyrinic acid a,c-diamide synthase